MARVSAAGVGLKGPVPCCLSAPPSLRARKGSPLQGATLSVVPDLILKT